MFAQRGKFPITPSITNNYHSFSITRRIGQRFTYRRAYRAAFGEYQTAFPNEPAITIFNST